MFVLAIAMLVILAVSALVLVYVTYPHRGQQVPGMPWVGDALTRAVDAMPVLDDDEADRLVRR